MLSAFCMTEAQTPKRMLAFHAALTVFSFHTGPQLCCRNAPTRHQRWRQGFLAPASAHWKDITRVLRAWNPRTFDGYSSIRGANTVCFTRFYDPWLNRYFIHNLKRNLSLSKYHWFWHVSMCWIQESCAEALTVRSKAQISRFFSCLKMVLILSD